MIPADKKNIVILETVLVKRDYLRSIFSQLGYTPFSFDTEVICFDNLSLLDPYFIVLGELSLEKISRVINHLKIRNLDLPVLILSNDHGIQYFLDINGFDHALVITKPLKLSDVNTAINRIQPDRINNKMPEDFPLIVGNSPGLVKIKGLISKLSRSKNTVLIQGEPGTGKELVARAVHNLSDRRRNPFIKVNIAAVSEELFEKEVLGYLPDASDGCQRNNKGILRIDDAVTLFIDKIEMAPMSIQSKMLQVLDWKSLSETGTRVTNRLDVRVIVAAGNNLGFLVEKRKFRKDLFYRLNVIKIEMPPLRNRSEDIPLLADFFSDRICRELGRCYFDIPQKNKELFLRYHWPGNVKELKNVIKNMVLTADKNKIPAEFMRHNLRGKPLKDASRNQGFTAVPEASDIKAYMREMHRASLKDIRKEFIKKTEKKLMKEALAQTNWNRKKASMLLDISYKSLLNKIKAYNIG